METKCKIIHGDTKNQLESEINKFLSSEVNGEQLIPVAGGKNKIKIIRRPPTVCWIVPVMNSVAIFYM